ncbi:MAG: MgtC/SapB family protein [Acholeplasmataceae bacterium]
MIVNRILEGAILDLNLGFEDVLLKVLLPIVLTYIIAAFVGLERQNVGKAAGLSSHVLVALGSVGIAIMQRLMFESQLESGLFTNPEGQRIIAQVVTGIGFVGAGAIIKDSSNSIKGITTAATIWVTAMVGLILGSGYIILGSTIGVVMVVLMLIRDISRGYNPLRSSVKKGKDKND